MEYFDDKDVFVVNNTKVFPARMYGRKEKPGPRLKFFFELNKANKLWDVIVDPARKIRVGNKLYFGENDELVCWSNWQYHQPARTIRFCGMEPMRNSGRCWRSWEKHHCQKYIKRKPEEDKERYQTVYAKHEGAVAPTAGLHFSKELIKRLRDPGCSFAEITLHTGLELSGR